MWDKITSSLFLNKVVANTKEAMATTSRFIRDRLLEDVRFTQIIPEEVPRQEDLFVDLNTNDPAVLIEKEPDAEAYIIPFWGDTVQKRRAGLRVIVKFFRIKTETIVFDKDQLKTDRYNILKYLEEKIVKKMAYPYDKKFYDTALAIVNDNNQKVTATTFSRSAIIRGIKAVTRREVPVAKMLMHRNVYYNMLDIPATEIGETLVTRYYDEGINPDTPAIFGVPVVLSIKTDVFPENQIWVFSSAEDDQNYLGKCYRLTDTTVVIKDEGPEIQMYAYKTVAAAIVQPKGVQLIEFSSI